MLDIHTFTHCDTFHCKQTTCLPHVNVTVDRDRESESQAVFNIGKKWFFKCPEFGNYWMQILTWGTKTILYARFKIMCLLLRLLMLLNTCCVKSKPKIWMHTSIKRCANRAKEIPIQGTQRYSRIWCSFIWCCRSLFMMPGQSHGYFLIIFSTIFGTTLQDGVQFVKTTVHLENRP